MRGLRDLFSEGFMTNGLEDVHVHTHACDDADQSPTDALKDARDRNLTVVCFTAHVRESTPIQHIEEYLADVQQAAQEFPEITVRTSLETKLMNTAGDLDLPPDLDLNIVDTLNVADHRFPLDTPRSPEEIRELLETTALSEADIWHALSNSYIAALHAYPGSIVAHPLSIIPKIGLHQNSAPTDFNRDVAQAIFDTGAVMEINNKWDCPGLPLIKAAHEIGVPIVAASDAHRIHETGQTTYLESLALT